MKLFDVWLSHWHEYVCTWRRKGEGYAGQAVCGGGSKLCALCVCLAFVAEQNFSSFLTSVKLITCSEEQ